MALNDSEKKLYQTLLSFISTNFTVLAVFCFAFLYLWKIFPRESSDFGFYVALFYMLVTFCFYFYLLYKVYYKDLEGSINDLAHKPFLLIITAFVVIGAIVTPLLFALEGKQMDLNKNGLPQFQEVNGIPIITIPKEYKDKIKIIYE